jgi:hypothetical protein
MPCQVSDNGNVSGALRRDNDPTVLAVVTEVLTPLVLFRGTLVLFARRSASCIPNALTTCSNWLSSLAGSRVPMVECSRAQDARANDFDEKLVLVTSAMRLFCFQGARLPRNAMQTNLRRGTGYTRVATRAGLRARSSIARFWTGRARVSTATNTAVPRCVATTTHRTRVSEMRFSPSRSNCESLMRSPLGAGTWPFERRRLGNPRPLSG